MSPGLPVCGCCMRVREIGYHGEILTEFGPRQRWQMIITDAEIEQDDILQENICVQCGNAQPYVLAQ